MKPLTLVGCGILKKEVEALIACNRWPVSCHFACSSLHVDFTKLRATLEKSLEAQKDEHPLVFYGTCHPLMETILKDHGTRRTEGQNCIEMLLGPDLFQRELAQGAFFLLEDWAHSWERIISLAIADRSLWKEIYGGQHRYVLVLRTPCSGEFGKEAQAFGDAVGLPLRWLDVSLDHLEGVLRKLLTEVEEERMQPRPGPGDITK